MRGKTRPPSPRASVNEVTSPAPNDGELHAIPLQAAPDQFQLDVDDFGLSEADYANIGFITEEQLEDEDFADAEGSFRWELWA